MPTNVNLMTHVLDPPPPPADQQARTLVLFGDHERRHTEAQGSRLPARDHAGWIGCGHDWGGGRLKPRSMVFDLFGDYLRYRGGEVRLRGLTALLGCFDVPEPTVRVVVARLRADGWLTSRREGREAVYGLTAASWQLLDEGRARIFTRAAGPWSGEWHMIIYSVPESDRALRDQLRKKLSWLGFGPLSSSVWISPYDRTQDIVQAFAQEPSVRLDVFRSRSATADSERDLAARAWALGELNDDYARWLATYQARLPRYRKYKLSGPAALVERTRLINDYRHFPFRDPDLPLEMLPPHWLGGTAYDVFIEAHDLLEKPAEAAVDELLRANAVIPTRLDG